MRHFATNAWRIKAEHSRWWLVCFVSIGLLTGFSCSPYALQLEQKTSLHWLFHWRGAISPPEDIKIVALNSEVAEKLELSHHSNEWSRLLHAQLIQRLSQANVRLIVMDVAFKVARDEQQDSALEHAIAEAGNVVLFKYLQRHQKPAGTGLADIEEEIAPLSRFSRHALAVGSFVLSKSPTEVSTAFLFSELPSGREATQPLLAYLALQPEAEQQQLWQMLYPETPMPKNLANRAQAFFHQQVSATSPRPHWAQPLSERVVINFYGGPHTLHTLPLDEVLQMPDTQLQQIFAGKIAYVGYSEIRQTEQKDVYRTVFTDARELDISGVEISATVLANLLQQNYVRAPTAPMLITISVAIFLLTLLCCRLPLWGSLSLQVFLAILYLFTAAHLFSSHHIWLPLLLPGIALLAANGLSWAHNYQVHKRREREIRLTLSQYLPSDAAHHLSRNFNRLEQQRQLVQGVCLLTDIQGYTRLAESLPPTELHALMNRYYAVLIQTVKEHGGFIGNLVGDGMLALWTGPAITTQMCASALQAALEIRRRLELEADLANRLPTCFGLHGGQFSLGNLGSSGHFEYSPVGDMINTASRIEHLNRDLGTRVLCSGPVVEHLPQSATGELRFLGNFQLRNKAESVSIYSHGRVEETLSTGFKQAFENYQNQDFGLALTCFTQMADEFADGPSAYYANLCRQRLTSAPP